MQYDSCIDHTSICFTSYRIPFILSVAPSSPSQPIVSEITAHSATLNWSAPSDDGGNSISSYIVEKKEHYSQRWLPIGTADDTCLKVEGLMEGSQYEFRVAAQNEAGVGKFSEASMSITAKEPYGKI